MSTTVIRIALGGLLFALAGSAAPAAHAGSNAAASGAAVTYMPAAQVRQAFTRGMLLLETDGYKIHASRRDAPGEAEVHVRDTDIIYVLEGTKTLVTGGDVVGGRTTATDEIRGASIRGGTAQRLAKGDLLIVPNGVAHQFTEGPVWVPDGYLLFSDPNANTIYRWSDAEGL